MGGFFQGDLTLPPDISYCLRMPRVPGCQPDGPKIRQLIWERGVNVRQFARSIDRNWNTIWCICANGDRASIESIRGIAAGLGVKPGDISDYKGDDATWSEPEPKALAS